MCQSPARHEQVLKVLLDFGIGLSQIPILLLLLWMLLAHDGKKFFCLLLLLLWCHCKYFRFREGGNKKTAFFLIIIMVPLRPFFGETMTMGPPSNFFGRPSFGSTSHGSLDRNP